MNKKDLKFIFAPLGVLFGICGFIFISLTIAGKLGIFKFSTLVRMPLYIEIPLGILLLIIFTPIFISGIYFLNRRGAVGQSENLRKNGIYKYVRNPMYIGVSLIIIGIGFILDKTGVIFAGVLWLILTYIQCKREEVELTNRFGQEYIQYKRKTPMFIPNFILMIRDLIKERKNDEKAY